MATRSKRDRASPTKQDRRTEASGGDPSSPLRAPDPKRLFSGGTGMEEEGKAAWPTPGETMADKERPDSAADQSATREGADIKADEKKRAQEKKKEQEAYKRLCKEEQELSGYRWLKVDKLGYSQLKARKKGQRLNEAVYAFYRLHGVEIIDDAPGGEDNTPDDAEPDGDEKTETDEDVKVSDVDEEDEMELEETEDGDPNTPTPETAGNTGEEDPEVSTPRTTPTNPTTESPGVTPATTPSK